MADKTKTSVSSEKIAEVTIPHYDANDKIDYYLGKVHVNIWIEGVDAEARRAIAGGQFQIHLDLSGVPM